MAALVGRQVAPAKIVPMRVALVQLASTSDSATNRAEIASQLAELTAGDAVDLVVLPEGSMHDFGSPDLDLRPVAEPLDGPFVQMITAEAERLQTTVIAGMFEQTDNLPFNTLVVVDSGGLRATYRKIHLYDSFGYRESDRLRAGDVEPIVVSIAGRSVGLMTCYDLRFPEHGRALIDAGAELLVVPAAWVAGEHKLHHWRTLLTARAIENTVHVVAAAQCGDRYTGHSAVIDPWGSIVVEAENLPTIVRAVLDAEDVTRARDVNPSLANQRIQT